MTYLFIFAICLIAAGIGFGIVAQCSGSPTVRTICIGIAVIGLLSLIFCIAFKNIT